MIEFAEKQTRQLDLIRKDIEETRRVEEIRASRQAAMAERARYHEQRVEAIRRKQFSDELTRNERSMQLRRANEAFVSLRSVSREMLRREREHALETRRYYVDQFRANMNEQMRRVESVENMCRDRVGMLRERMRDEKENWRVREQATSEYMGRMRQDVSSRINANMKRVQDVFYRGQRAFAS